MKTKPTMKYTLIILLLILTSCDSKKKEDANVIDDQTIVTELVESKTEFNLLATVLKNLNIEKENCKLDLVAIKESPTNPEETIIAIPEIVERDPNDESYYGFNSYILIVDTNTGEIKQSYFETAKINGWISDAIILADIKIDIAPYRVSENKRAFGVRVYYHNNSQPNPFSYEAISLFIKKDNSLLKILNNYNAMEYHGESDTVCYGDFIAHTKVFIMSKEKTNGYFNILVKNTITETKRRPDKNEDCIVSEVITSEVITLTLNNLEYK